MQRAGSENFFTISIWSYLGKFHLCLYLNFVNVLREELALAKEKKARSGNLYLIIGESKILQKITIIFSVDNYDNFKNNFQIWF